MSTFSEKWRGILTRLGGLWIHDGNPSRPHALLTSGKHSNGFFNGSVMLRDPNMVWSICRDLRDKAEREMRAQLDQDVVIGSAMGAITMAHELAKLMGAMCGFTERVGDSMVLGRFAFDDEAGGTVQVVEDVITTGGTTRKTIRAIEAAGGEVIGPVLAFVNRSGMASLDGRPIISLVDHHLPVWTPEECPLCKGGSEAVRPKTHWQELTARLD